MVGAGVGEGIGARVGLGVSAGVAAGVQANTLLLASKPGVRAQAAMQAQLV